MNIEMGNNLFHAGSFGVAYYLSNFETRRSPLFLFRILRGLSQERRVAMGDGAQCGGRSYLYTFFSILADHFYLLAN